MSHNTNNVRFRVGEYENFQEETFEFYVSLWCIEQEAKTFRSSGN